MSLNVLEKAVTNQNIQNTIIPLFSGYHCTIEDVSSNSNETHKVTSIYIFLITRGFRT